MPTSAAKRRLQDELQSGKLDFKGKMQLALINERNGCTVAEIAARHPDVTDRMVRSWEEERLNHDLLIAASLVYERHWTKPAFVAAGVDFDPEGIRMLENMLLDLRKSFFTRVKEPIEETSEKTEARFVYELRGSRPQIKKFSESKNWEDYVKIFDFKGRRGR